MAAFARILLIAAFCAVPTARAESAGSTSPQDVLEAERAGLVAVKYVPNDSRSAQIVVSNRSGRPLTLRLPAAFAGVPVLAQVGMGGGGGNQAGFGAGGIGAAPQSTGGGVANAGMGIGGGGGGGGFCWVAREVYGVHDPRWLEFRGWLHADAPAWLREAYLAHGEAFAATVRSPCRRVARARSGSRRSAWSTASRSRRRGFPTGSSGWRRFRPIRDWPS
jgi:hypothetical protein